MANGMLDYSNMPVAERRDTVRNTVRNMEMTPEQVNAPATEEVWATVEPQLKSGGVDDDELAEIKAQFLNFDTMGQVVLYTQLLNKWIRYQGNLPPDEQSTYSEEYGNKLEEIVENIGQLNGGLPTKEGMKEIEEYIGIPVWFERDEDVYGGIIKEEPRMEQSSSAEAMLPPTLSSTEPVSGMGLLGR